MQQNNSIAISSAFQSLLEVKEEEQGMTE